MTLEAIQGCVGRGWSALLADLVADLLRLGWDGEVLQVKEKWGGLRFYPGDVSDAMDERISKAERDSFLVCEHCGQPGQLRGGCWIQTLCDDCEKTQKGGNT